MIKEKVMTLSEAISTFVEDGCSISQCGLIMREPVAACHEIIRQGKKNLTYVGGGAEFPNMLIGAGAISRAETAYIWIGVVGAGLNYRRAVENGIPNQIEVEEYSLNGISLRFLAGSLGVPYLPTHSLLGSDLPKYNPKIKITNDPYNGEPVALVPQSQPDVAIIHVQRADELGNCQIWGYQGLDLVLGRAAKKVIVTTEEIIPTSEIRKNPNMTALPYYCVDAVVHVPYGAHPQSCTGYYWVDTPFRREFMVYNRTHDGFLQWLKEWVFDVGGWDGYLEKVGKGRLEKLAEMEKDNITLPL